MQFSGSILAVAFKAQSEKWEPLVLSHISKSILLAHDYIYQLLNHVCHPHSLVRDQLWETILVEQLRKAYIKAIEQARFLLRIERDFTPSTYNHYFNSEIQKKRLQRMNTEATKYAVEGAFSPNSKYQQKIEKAVPVRSLQNLVTDKDNAQQVQEDIHDILEIGRAHV